MTEERDDKLMRAARRMTPELQPRNDLWPGIARAIERPGARRWTPMLARAAAIVLLIGASSTVTVMVMKDDPVTIVVPADRIFEQLAFTSRYSLGMDYKDARNVLVAELDLELAKLPAAARADFEVNLQLMHSAIIETNNALEEEPDNAVLQGRLLHAYRDELELLRRVSRLSRNVMVRNDL